MIFIIVLTIFALLLIAKKFASNKLALALITTYILWYGFWLSVSTFNFYELYEVSTRAYLYQLLGVVMLTIGFAVHPEIKKKCMSNTIAKSLNLQFENSIGFKIVLIISLIYVLSVFIAFKEKVSAGVDVRTLFFQDPEIFFGKGYLVLVWRWLIVPFEYIVLVLLCIRLIKRKFLHAWPIVYTVFLILYGYVGAGREHYINFLIVLIIVYIINTRTNLIAADSRKSLFASIKKPKILLGFLFLCSIVVFASGYITSIREGNAELTLANTIDGIDVFFKQVVVYNIGPFRAFDYALSNDYIGLIGQLYGRGAFAAVDEFFYFLSCLLKIRFYVSSNDLISPVLQQNQILIGDYQVFNFAYTQFMIFYLDFEVLGIIIFSFIYGYFYRKVVNLFIYNPNLFSLILLVFLTHALISSNFKYSLQTMPYLVIIVYSLFFNEYYKKNRI